MTSRLKLRLRNLFARTRKPKLSTEALGRRVKRVAESILDNERLTADLDDSAAKELLDWGLTIAKQIAQETADLDADDEAEQAMYPRLRATRRMMRSVNQWIANQREGDSEGSATALAEIVEHAGVIYGRAFHPPSDEQRDALTRAQSELGDDPPQMIARLRQLIENLSDVS